MSSIGSTSYSRELFGHDARLRGRRGGGGVSIGKSAGSWYTPPLCPLTPLSSVHYLELKGGVAVNTVIV